MVNSKKKKRRSTRVKLTRKKNFKRKSLRKSSRKKYTKRKKSKKRKLMKGGDAGGGAAGAGTRQDIINNMADTAETGYWNGVFKILEENPTFINAQPDGQRQSPLMHALHDENIHVVLALFHMGADISDINKPELDQGFVNKVNLVTTTCRLPTIREMEKGKSLSGFVVVLDGGIPGVVGEVIKYNKATKYGRHDRPNSTHTICYQSSDQNHYKGRRLNLETGIPEGEYVGGNQQLNVKLTKGEIKDWLFYVGEIDGGSAVRERISRKIAAEPATEPAAEPAAAEPAAAAAAPAPARPNKITISVVDLESNTDFYEISPDDTLEGLKVKIFEERGVNFPVKNQRLILGGKKLDPELFGKIKDGARLHLVMVPLDRSVALSPHLQGRQADAMRAMAAAAPAPARPDKITISLVDLESNTDFYEISPDDTLEDLKVKIFEKRGANFPVKHQRLILGGRQLDTELFASGIIKDGARLHLVMRPLDS